MIKEFISQLDNLVTENEQLKRMNETQGNWLDVTQQILKEKNELLRQYERKINDLRNESELLRISKQNWFENWVTAGSRLFDTELEIMKLQEEIKELKENQENDL